MNGSTIYGFAFVDYAALKFWVGSVSDDDSRAALGALLMQVSSVIHLSFFFLWFNELALMDPVLQVLAREIIYESSGIKTNIFSLSC